MIKPISFGSTYKIRLNDVKQNEQSNKHFATLQFCNTNRIDYASYLDKKEERKKIFENQPLGVTTTIVAKDEDDEKVENFLKEQNIECIKYLSSMYMNPYMVISRLEPAPKGYSIELVDVKKLSKLVKRQPSSSYEWSKEDYERHGKLKSTFLLKSCNRMKTAMLYLSPLNEDEDLIENLKKNKIKNLPKDSISIDIVKPENDPDINTFFAMVDAGFSEIPVYVDKETQELGHLLGLFHK